MNKSGDVQREPIAIVGIGCRLPGGANDPTRFWDLLSNRVDAVGDVPPDRWDVSAYHDASGKRPGTITARRGAFIENIDEFDPTFFGISPREATRMDPQQRLLLEVAWEAMEDAGQIPSKLAGTPVGVFVGISWNDYSAIQLAKGNQDSIDTHTGTGGAMSIAANRISHVFDFRGPSVAVDTACSSALVAVHLACQALWSGDCDIALAGGVNAMIIPAYFIALSRLAMLSAEGKCRAFDANGKGYVRGEGAGLVALRPLSAAVANGDRIYAVVRGTAVNQDGHTNGITVPSQAAQEAVVREACRRAGVKPADVQYVEAHGTGTPVGDPIEARALGAVLGAGRAKGDACRLGSVKTNIGHLESAAGIAGLIKATLALSNEAIPPNLHFDMPHPDIPFDKIGMRVVTKLEPWIQNGKPRYAGVNSFGFGGTNAHVILGDAPPSPAPTIGTANGTQQRILPISARTAAALRTKAADYERTLANLGTSTSALDDVCRTAAVRRDHLEHRVTIVAPNADEMREQLASWLSGGNATAVRAGRTSETRKAPAFVFCGQGPQWWGMARGLLVANNVFSAGIGRIDTLLRRDAGWSLREELLRDETSTRVHQTNILQPAIFAVQLALVDLWHSWGIEPSAVVGHSMGEVAAAYAAQALSLDDAVRLIYHRGRVQHQAAGTGKMLAVGITRASAEVLLSDYPKRLWIAGENGPSSVTIGGEIAAIDELSAFLAKQGVFHRAVRMEMACHTPHMDPFRNEFLRSVRDIHFRAPVKPFYSTVTGERVTDVLDAEYWWKNFRQPVEFLAAAEQLVAEGITAFIELGPHPVLASGIAEVLSRAGKEGGVLPSLRRTEDDETIMLGSLASLYALGEPVEWRGVVGDGAGVARLPTYPWQRQRYWNESQRALRERLGTQRKPLLGARQPGPGGCWESTIDGARYPFLAHHVVQETIVVPGAALGILSLMAADADLPGEGRVVVEELEFAKPLFIPNDGAQTVQLTLSADGVVQIHSRTESREEAWTRHATARARRESPAAPPSSEGLQEIRARCDREVATADLYGALAAKGIHLGSAFQGVAGLWAGNREALARIEAPAELAAEVDSYPLHPVLLDSCLQAFLTAMPEGHSGLHLPVEIGRLRMYVRQVGARFWVHVKITSATERTVEGDALLLDDAGNVMGEATGCRVRAVHDTASVARAEDDLLYQFQWQQKALDVGAPSDFFAEPAKLATAAVVAFERSIAGDWARYEEYYERAQPRFESLAMRYVAEAFASLGAGWHVGDRIVAGELAKKLGVVDKHARLFERLVSMLADDGHLVRDRGEFVVALPLSRLDETRPQAAGLVADFPWAAPEIALLTRCASALAGVLRGELDAVQVVFPNGGLADVEHLNQDFPVLRSYNAVAAAIVAQLVEGLPAGRTLRILEIGGGTGALTARVLDVLPVDRTDYLHTDISPLFGREARQKFAAFPFVRYEILDIERDPAEQGFEHHSFDLVLAGNVLHATRDLEHTLANARSLLAPGGIALVLEATKLPTWVELIFGLTDGWWAFADNVRAGAQSPLLDSEHWLTSFASSGFSSAAVVTDPRRVGQPGHAVYVAQSPLARAAVEQKHPGETDTRRWLILADRGGIGASIATELESRGATCDVVARPDMVDAQAIDAIVAHARGVAPPHEVLYCWSLDAHSADDSTTPDIAAAQILVTEGAFHLSRAILSTNDVTVPPHLTFLTADSQAVTSESAHAIAQAPLWGFGRVLMSEHQEFAARLIDLSVSNGTDINALTNELLRGKEDEVAIRASRRYVRRLVRRPDLRASTSERARTGERGFALHVATPGVLDTLEYRGIARRVPGPNEVEVQVDAAALNFKDVMLAMGMLPDHALDASYGGWTLGREFAGTVTAVGEGVTHVAVGDDVLGLGAGAFGSFVITFAAAVVRRPKSLTAGEAAAIPLVFVTAYLALNHIGHMAAGDRVLIHSASGGVGLAAIQLAQRAGAEIFATAGTDEKRAFVKGLGVQHVLDSRSLSFAEEIVRITKGEGVDLVLNTLPGEAIEKGLEVLRPNGRFLEIGRRDIWQNSRIGLKHFTRNLSFVAIDVDRSGREQPELIAQVFREVVAGFDDGSLSALPFMLYEPDDVATAFRLMAQSRHTGKLVVAFKDRTVSLASTAADDTPPIRVDATYLLTGGLGGFGLVVADWLVRNGARNLVLTGRSGAASAESVAAVARLRATGARIEVIQADITREADVRKLFLYMEESMPPLRGVMHMAMVIDDAYVLQLDVERVRRVMAPKIEGAWNLHQVTKTMELDWFVLYSSGAAVFGNPGQSNYAAANMFMPALAHYRRAQGLPALSVDWGRLADVGYVAQHEKVGQYLDRQGYPSFTPAEALSSLGILLRRNETEASVLRVDWPRWRNFFPTTLAISQRFAGVAAAGIASSGSSQSTEKFQGRRLILASPISERPLKLVGLVLEHIARVLGTTADSLDAQRRLSELGLDSLMAVELRNRLEREFGVDIPVMTLLQGPTIAGVASLIGAGIGDGRVVIPSEAKNLRAPAAPVVIPSETRNRQPSVAPAVIPSEARDLHPQPQTTSRNGAGNGTRPSWFRRNGPYLTATALRTVARIDIQGLENIPLDGPLILAANHVNALDALLMFSFVPRRMSCFVKESLKNQPIVGWFARDMLDAIWVSRGTGDETALAQAIQVVKRGGALAINPEGTRSRTGILQKGQTGVAFIAGQTGARVVPVVAWGHEKLPRSIGGLSRTPISVRVGQAIDLSSAGTADDFVSNTDLLMRTMAAMLPSAYRGVYANESSVSE